LSTDTLLSGYFSKELTSMLGIMFTAQWIFEIISFEQKHDEFYTWHIYLQLAEPL